jgi:sugar phosphate isomerase/epimerase
MLSRRTFLQRTLLAAASASLPVLHAAGPSRGAPAAAVGSQLYGWGQYLAREGKNLDANLEQVLAQVKECGYEYAETSLNVSAPEENSKLADKMKSAGLRPVALYTGGPLHDEVPAEKTIASIKRAAGAAASAGFTIINCNPDPIGRAKTPAELHIQVQSLNRLGAELTELGMKLGIHNHTPAMQNGHREFYHDLDATKPRDAGLCYDVHWVFRGGLKPQEVLPKYGHRVVSWHLRQSHNGVWCEALEAGDVDYAWIASYVREHKLAEIFSVELAMENGTEVTRSVIENHKRSRDFVKKTFGI